MDTSNAGSANKQLSRKENHKNAQASPHRPPNRPDRPTDMSSLKRRGLSTGCRPVVLLAFGLRVGGVG